MTNNRAVRVISGVLTTIGIVWTISFIVSAAPRLNIVLGVLQYVTVSAALFLPLCFLRLRVTKRAPKGTVPWFDILAAVLSFALPLYIFATYSQEARWGWAISPTTEILVMGIIMCLLIIEAARRTTGMFFAGTVAVLAAAPLYAHLLPDFLKGPSFGYERLIGTLFVSAEGMFGSVMRIFVLLFLAFIVFGVAVQITGGGKFFTDIALSLLGQTRGGAAKVSVISSALFGTISGSGAANVMVTGAVTIPMMKKGGYAPHFAAAVEATASAGGLIMPPVMGATAFIMADFLGIPYWQVALAAAVPAILYYMALYAQVHFHAVNAGLRGVPRSELPPLKRTLLEGWSYSVVFLVLVYFLFVAKMSAGISVLLALVTLLLLCAIKKTTRPNLGTMRELIEGSAGIFAQITPILLAVGLILGGLSLSGLGYSITQWIRAGAGESAWIFIPVTALIALVLGTGMPGPAVYLLLAVMLGPSLESLGFNRLAVHMSFLYWGIISNFTPPVAIMSYIAAGYAGASPTKTALQSMRLAMVMFIAPIFFIVRPVLILENFEVISFITVFVPIAIGIWLLAGAFEGYGMPQTHSKIVRRVMSLVASVMLFTMIWYIQLVGGVLAFALLVPPLVQRLRRRSAVPAVVTGTEEPV